VRTVPDTNTIEYEFLRISVNKNKHLKTFLNYLKIIIYDRYEYMTFSTVIIILNQ